MHLKFIATTYDLTIFKTHVQSLYSHLCIFVSMYIYSRPATHGISGLAAGGSWEQFMVRLIMTIRWTQRYIGRPWSGEFVAVLRGHDCANLVAIIEWVGRYFCRLWLSERRDALRGSDWVWRSIWRLWLSMIWGQLGGGRWEVRQVLMTLFMS